ncbi:bifunctional lysylphosphatidylglycerol flippase/synthetase MprF [Massilia oculi]|uniref:bifunctional lysylphosphatidylglycerol flippase/synthetase MprF n=1 Tax=Massilia oculi TaxID=945844 RepID=UPI0028AE7076|nr:bifunctional lysylphosphatidylglycerol flippase/synthetase MprF [Massilia oculi]
MPAWHAAAIRSAERTAQVSSAPMSSKRARLRSWLAPTVAAVLLCAALWVLHNELQAIRYRDLQAALARLGPDRLLLALLCCATNYLVLSCYDQLAFVYIGRRIARARIALTAFIGYAISNSVGFALLSGTAVRHRFYSRWGVGGADLSRIVALNGITYWLGLLALGGWSLVNHPHAWLQGELAQRGAQWLGLACLALVGAYLLLPLVRRTPLRVRGFDMRIPPLPLTLGQLLVSMTDWMLAASVLYALLPPGAPPYPVVLGVFLAAQMVALLSHVPGGLGVFDGIVALLLAPWLRADQIVAALLLYRIVYYLIPLSLALLLLVGDETRHRRARLRQFGQSLGQHSVRLAPRLLSLFTFMAGLLLLVSGATPAAHGRLHSLSSLFPIGVFEASHFVGSIVGVALLLLAQAIARRIRLAWYLAVGALAAGIAASLLKAGDWEEATLLALLLLVFVPSRRLFERRAALFDTRFSPGWIVAIAAAFGASLWIGVFAYRHVDYANELWWQVALHDDAPRFLRASLGAAVVLFAFGVSRLLRPLPHLTEPPSGEALADAERIVHAQGETLPFLAWLRDKELLFNPERTAFIMYGVRGRTWVALGDPVGPPAAAAPLIRDFVERADDYGATPVFYQVHAEQLHCYADLGMAFAKFGEEARIRLDGLSLAGGRFKELRAATQRLKREHVDFRIVAPEAVPAILPQLRTVSDDWLAGKAGGEKGFSLGFFADDYLTRQPVAVLEREGRIVAFANLLCGPTGEELSIDLMRFMHAAPRGLMDGLLTHVFLWGQEHGYRWFNLGMAPLSGVPDSAGSPMWNRLAGFVYRHGESIYKFQGLRAYKEKFHPVWEPRYIAYAGGKLLPVLLADIAALSARGYARIFL